MDKMKLYHRAVENCVTVDDNTGRAYVEPLWREILESEGVLMKEADEPKVLEVLELAVKKSDAKNDKTNAVMEWLYELITATIDPAMVDQENEMLKTIVENMQKNKPAE